MRLRTEAEVQMIKKVRCLTSLLGKLGLKCMLQEHAPPPNWAFMSDRPSVYYGLSLKEAADYTHNYLMRTGKTNEASPLINGLRRYNG